MGQEINFSQDYQDTGVKCAYEKHHLTKEDEKQEVATRLSITVHKALPFSSWHEIFMFIL